MRILPLIVAVGSIVLGLMLIANGFMEPSSESAPTTEVAVAPYQAVHPLGPGIALLAGGVFLFILILRRR